MTDRYTDKYSNRPINIMADRYTNTDKHNGRKIYRQTKRMNIVAIYLFS